jgi:hypothetical protein
MHDRMDDKTIAYQPGAKLDTDFQREWINPHKIDAYQEFERIYGDVDKYHGELDNAPVGHHQDVQEVRFQYINGNMPPDVQVNTKFLCK